LSQESRDCRVRTERVCRESESEALSVVSAASDGVLRSEATQRGSSLDEKQNNRNTGIPASFQALKRNRYCGAWTVVRRSNDGLVELHRVNCKCWSCSYCGPRKARRYRFLIAQLAEQEQLNRFVTLTLDPSKIQGCSVRYLRRVFNKFRLYMRRAYGVPIKYIAVLEFHKSGIAHLHLLIDRFIPWEWIKRSWSALGGGQIVFVKYVDVHRISHYLSKYLTKEMLLSAPQRSRRVTTSRSLRLIPKRESDATWFLLRVSIFVMYARWFFAAFNIQLDADGVLESFSYAAQTL
jgi:hypothetical protein